MAWVGVIYYGKCDYSILINCILHFVRGKFNQNYFKIFTFFLIWDKNFGSLTGLPIAKPLSLLDLLKNLIGFRSAGSFIL